MKINRVEQKDLPKLKILLDELIDADADIDNMSRILDEINNQDKYVLFGVYKDEELIGTASTLICSDISGDCTPFLVMENFIVDKKYRNCGVGTYLLNEVEKHGKRHSCRYIIFTSSTKRSKAHSFYQNNGYEADNVRGYKKYL